MCALRMVLPDKIVCVRLRVLVRVCVCVLLSFLRVGVFIYLLIPAFNDVGTQAVSLCLIYTSVNTHFFSFFKFNETPLIVSFKSKTKSYIVCSARKE